MYRVWCSTRRVGNDLLKDPVAPGSPTFSPFSAISPPHPYWWYSLVTLSFLFSFPPSILSLRRPRSSPCFEASCVTLLMTLRKHAVSTSSKLPGHDYISWLTGPLPCQPLIIMGRRRMGWKEEEWGKCELSVLTHFLSLCHTCIKRHHYFLPPLRCLFLHSSPFFFILCPLCTQTDAYIQSSQGSSNDSTWRVALSS